MPLIAALSAVTTAVATVAAIVVGGEAVLAGAIDLIVLSVGYLAAASLVHAAAPGHRIAKLLLRMGAAAAVGALAGALAPISALAVQAQFSLSWLAYGPVAVLLLVLPDGTLLSRRWRVWLGTAWLGVALPTIGAIALAIAAPEFLRSTAQMSPPATALIASGLVNTGVAATALALVAGIVSLVLRWRRSGRARGAAGRLLVLVGAVPVLGVTLDAVGVPGAYLLGAVTFPLIVLTAALRHRLLDMDLVVDRALVWLGATVLLVGAFVGLVWLTSWGLLGASTELVAPIAALALATAVLIAPLHNYLRKALYRGLYGRRDEPDAAFATLDERVDAADPHGVLDAAAEAIAESLALPFVAVEVTDDGNTRRAVFGRPAGEPVHLPLLYRGREVGAVEVTARSRRERLTDRERSTVVVLARAAVTAARSVALADSLQTARERLVHAREEERLRLRHDLHDGVSPTLAGMRLLARSLQRDPDPATAGTLLDAAGMAAEEVTRVVDGLRPPDLDVGLARALDQLADRMSGGPTIRVDAENCPTLTPAVEVALYRIASEALSNALRHARATSCTIRLEQHGDRIELLVTDDGAGLHPSSGRVGVGLASMRIRAEELGGTCEVDAPRVGGTRVRVRIPQAAPAVPAPREGRDERAVV